MRVVRVDPDNPSPEVIAEAARVIKRGGLVVFPTETVYGVAADAFNEEAVSRVFEVKRRPRTQPLPVMVASSELVGVVAREVAPAAARLIERFFPGPLTLVLKRSPELPDLVAAGGDTVGVRIPDQAVALSLLRELSHPVVATSANLHGGPEPKTVEDAVSQIGEGVELAIDAGEVRIGIASTVVDMTVTPPRILRAGAIPKQILEQEIGEVMD